MAKAKFDIKTEATKGLYAGAGVADVAVEYVRDVVADVQTRFASYQKDTKAKVADVQKQVTDFDLQPQALREQATTVVTARVEALTKEAKARQAAVEARVNRLQADAKAIPTKVQALVDENVATINDTYADLARRGEELIERLRNQESTKAAAASAKSTTAKVKATRTSATKTAKSATTTAKTTAKKATEGAKKTTTTAKRSAATPKKRAATTKSSAKGAATAAKKTAAKATTAAKDGAAKVGD